MSREAAALATPVDLGYAENNEMHLKGMTAHEQS